MPKPVKMHKDELAGILRAIAASIEAGDSFEGSLTYSCLNNIFPTGDDEIVDMDDLGPGELRVTGVYRVGNSMGQGGINLIGEQE